MVIYFFFQQIIINDNMNLIFFLIGRSGKPKKKVIYCDNILSKIYWSETPNETNLTNMRFIDLTQIIELRHGNEMDPESKKLTGTSILRRNCSKADLNTCFSFILPDRSFDIQCCNQNDFNLLYVNFKSFLKQTIINNAG